MFSKEVEANSLKFHKRFRNFLPPGLITRGVTITWRSHQGLYLRGSPRGLPSHIFYLLSWLLVSAESRSRDGPIRGGTYHFSARSRDTRIIYGCLGNHDHVIAPSGIEHSRITTKPVLTLTRSNPSGESGFPFHFFTSPRITNAWLPHQGRTHQLSARSRAYRNGYGFWRITITWLAHQMTKRLRINTTPTPLLHDHVPVLLAHKGESSFRFIFWTHRIT